MNKTYLKNSAYKAKQSGFTLLEILVALVLGIGILTAAISMQFQHRKGFKQSTNKLAMQTNAKFAFEFIGQSLRSAGSMGCKNGEALTGGKVKTLSGNCQGKVCSAFVSPFDSTNVAFADFRPGYEVKGYEFVGTGMVPNLPGEFTFVSSKLYNDNSDILTVSGGYGEVYELAGRDSGVGFLPVSTGTNIDVTNISDVRLKQFQYGMLASCEGAYFFKITSTDAEIDAGVITWAGGGGNADDNADGLMGDTASTVLGTKSLEFRRAAVVTYFVGDNDNGVPTLYQDVDGVSSRLVDGVEEIHIQYGLSTSPSFKNVADRYVSASVIDAESDPAAVPPVNLWKDVVSVRIGLIMRSIEPVYEDYVLQDKIKLNCVGYIQPAKTDKYMRSTYCADIALRNRLTGSRIAVRDK